MLDSVLTLANSTVPRGPVLPDRADRRRTQGPGSRRRRTSSTLLP